MKRFSAFISQAIKRPWWAAFAGENNQCNGIERALATFFIVTMGILFFAA